MWYKHKIKWQKTHIPPVLRIALDLRYMIYDHIFEESKMVDITITERGSTKRRHGSQSILLVNKQIRNEALKIFYQKCTFEIPHFKLHEQHRRENPMTGLKHIFKLDVLWTPPPERAFTTTAGDDRLLLSLLELRQLTINVLSLQYIRLKANLTPVKFQEEVIKKLEKIMPSFPRWITRALDACPRRPGLKLFLVVYVAVGNEREVLKQDLTVSLHESCETRQITNTSRLLQFHGQASLL